MRVVKKWKCSSLPALALVFAAASGVLIAGFGTAHAQPAASPPAAKPSEPAATKPSEPAATKPSQPTAPKPSQPAKPEAAKSAQVKRGEYLVTIASCHDCHTPMKMTPLGPMPDFERSLSGHPPTAPEPSGTPGKTDLMLSGGDLTSFRLPFGIVYSRNLTPDKSGLGDWTEAQFVKALRTGRHQGEGRPLLLPMPWFNLAAMTDEDLKAVYAFLRSIKPIANTVPDPKVPPAVIEQFTKTNAGIVEMMKGPPPGKKPAAAAPTPPPAKPAAAPTPPPAKPAAAPTPPAPPPAKPAAAPTPPAK